jgi:hypothetical protein
MGVKPGFSGFGTETGASLFHPVLKLLQLAAEVRDSSPEHSRSARIGKEAKSARI